MGLLSNPLGRPSREQRLPLYRNAPSPTKERLSDDGYDSSDSDSDASYSHSSTYTSGTASDAAPSRSLLLPRRPRPPPPRRKHTASVYPYRLPTKVTRYIFFGLAGFILLFIFSLIRASQVENWKLANGKVLTPPPPPPLWEKFPFLERYYGGIRSLAPFRESKPEYPRPNEPLALARPDEGRSAVAEETGTETGTQTGTETEDMAGQHRVVASKPWGEYPGRSVEPDAQECFVDAAGKVRPPSLRYFEGRPLGFPENVVGSYDALKLPEDICFERFGRYGPYGFGYSTQSGGLGVGEHGESEGSAAVWEETPRVDYREVDWADAQRRCYEKNVARFHELPRDTPAPHGFYVGHDGGHGLSRRGAAAKASSGSERGSAAEEMDKVEAKARTAVVVRCWDEFLFGADDVANLRSMIAELSLGSGGRYDVHLLVQVKNDAQHPVWADHEAYEKRVRDSIPAEFQGLVTLWTETQMLALYQGIHDLWTRGPELPVHGVYRGLSMAMQYFAYMHPEYEFFWQWEMDVRYTGSYHDLLAKLEGWAKAQPRKGLWERSSRYYLPTVHGSWDDFSHMSRVQSEMGVGGGPDDVRRKLAGERGGDRGGGEAAGEERKTTTVWGPVRPADHDDWFDVENDDVPKTPAEADRHQWGVGEEADLITLNPIFDPDGTTWLLRDDITGFNQSRGQPPRRAAIVTTSRLSRRLLLTMHRATAYKKQFAFAEMWAATVALQHGFKAVFAPHPMYVDRRWPTGFMAQTYNGGRDATAGGARTSVFGEREHNLRGLSWFYSSGFAPNLYRRWLGLRVNNDGGDEFETTGDESKHGGAGPGSMRGGEGRMCLPPMLLHPVKDVELPVEAPPADETAGAVPESDPAA